MQNISVTASNIIINIIEISVAQYVLQEGPGYFELGAIWNVTHRDRVLVFVRLPRNGKTPGRKETPGEVLEDESFMS